MPAHIIGADDAVLRRFDGVRFAPGLLPLAPALGDMHELSATLSQAAALH